MNVTSIPVHHHLRCQSWSRNETLVVDEIPTTLQEEVLADASGSSLGTLDGKLKVDVYVVYIDSAPVQSDWETPKTARWEKVRERTADLIKIIKL